ENADEEDTANDNEDGLNENPEGTYYDEDGADIINVIYSKNGTKFTTILGENTTTTINRVNGENAAHFTTTNGKCIASSKNSQVSKTTIKIDAGMVNETARDLGNTKRKV
ncbi:hypothetical protein SK128_024201, partial [Halocaridina rubra]